MPVAGLKISFIALAALGLAGCAQDKPHSFTDNSRIHTPNRDGHHGFSSAKADPFAGKGSPYIKSAEIPFGGGNAQVGKPYQVAGRWFVPKDQPGYDKVGMASWYGEAFHRRKTANGEYFDMATLTAAHPTFPLPSYAVVTNLENGRNVIVRVNDRGPFVGSRVIDLSKRAADELDYRHKGKTKVRVRYLGRAPVQDSMGHVMAMNQAMSGGASMSQLASLGGNNRAVAQTPITVAAATPQHLRRQTQQASLPPPEASPAAYTVRVAVFHDMANANAAYARLASFGPTHITRGVGANGPLYRVEIGPLDNKADADAALTTAQGSGYEGAQLMPAETTQISMQ